MAWLTKKYSELDANYIKSISYGRANDEQKYTTLPCKFHWENCDFSSQMSLIRFKVMEIQVHGNFTTIFKVVSQIVMTLFSDAATGAAP